MVTCPPLLSSLLAMALCLIGANPGPGLDAEAGTYVDPSAAILVSWDPTLFTADTGENGRLVLTINGSRGEITVVAGDSARDCHQRLALETGTAPGVMFFDLSFANRPQTDPGAVSGIFQLLHNGVQQIAYVECRPLPDSDTGGSFVAVQILAPAAGWTHAMVRWEPVLMSIKATPRNQSDAALCGCDPLQT